MSLLKVWAAVYIAMILGLSSGILLAVVADHVHVAFRWTL